MFRRHFRVVDRVDQQQIRRFVYHHVLHADDPPHRLALGAAIGVFVAVTPTLGVQLILVVLLAWLLRANKVIGLPIVWITNPATAVPIYYPCYRVGRFLLGNPGIGRAWWKELAHPPEEWTEAMTFYWSKFVEIALPLWVGSLVVGTVLAWITYYVVYRAVAAYRMHKWGQLSPPVDRQRTASGVNAPRPATAR